MEKRSINNTLENVNIAESPGSEGRRVWWLVNEDSFASTKGMFAITEFAPRSKHELHCHLNCETVTFVLKGSISYLSSGEPVRLSEREVVYIPPGDWHGYHNDGDQPTTIITVYGGAASLEEAGYKVHKSGEPKPTSSAFRKLPAPGDIANDSTLTYDPTLTEELGFRGMGNHWYVRGETVNAKEMLVSITRFAPSGSHLLHTHSNAEEFFFILEGRGTHLTESGEVPLGPGELAFTPVNKAHGFRNDPDLVTLVLFGWFGAINPEASGYNLFELER